MNHDDIFKYLKQMMENDDIFDSLFGNGFSLSYIGGTGIKPVIKINGKVIEKADGLINPQKHTLKDGIRKPFIETHINDGYLRIMAELPGVRKEDIELQLNENVLELEAPHSLDKGIKYRVEIPIEDNVDWENVSSRLLNGILEISIKIKEKIKTKIKVE